MNTLFILQLLSLIVAIVSALLVMFNGSVKGINLIGSALSFYFLFVLFGFLSGHFH